MAHKKALKNAVVLQSGGPTAVINRTLIGILEAWTIYGRGILFGSLFGIKGLLNNKLIALYPTNCLRLHKIGLSPSAALGTSRHSLKKSGKPNEKDLEIIFENLIENHIGYVFLIGGEDSRENGHTLSLYLKDKESDIVVVHVPKTIDNDLTLTHHSPGYGSAAQFVVEAVAGIDLDNRAMPGVVIDIIMGRSAGWLTAAAFLARKCVYPISLSSQKSLIVNPGPHLIYLPETPFSIEKFLADIDLTMRNCGRSHIALAEGIAEHKEITDYIENLGGTSFLKEICGKDSFGHPQLSGNGVLGLMLCHMVKRGLNPKRVRANTFDQLQRSFNMVSKTDAKEAYKVGAYAVKHAVRDRRHMMVVIENGDESSSSLKITHADISAAFVDGQPRIKLFPEQFIVNGHSISDSFEGYMGINGPKNKALVKLPNFAALDL